MDKHTTNSNINNRIRVLLILFFSSGLVFSLPLSACNLPFKLHLCGEYDSKVLLMPVSTIETNALNPEESAEETQKLTIGSSAPGFDAEMFEEDVRLRFDGVFAGTKYEMILFYTSKDSGCQELLKELARWYSMPENKGWFDIVTVALDNERKSWEESFQKNQFEWHDVWAEGGVNSSAASDYGVRSTPVIYIVNKEMKIAALPNSVKEIEKFLNQ